MDKLREDGTAGEMGTDVQFTLAVPVRHKQAILNHRLNLHSSSAEPMNAEGELHICGFLKEVKFEYGGPMTSPLELLALVTWKGIPDRSGQDERWRQPRHGN